MSLSGFGTYVISGQHFTISSIIGLKSSGTKLLRGDGVIISGGDE